MRYAAEPDKKSRFYAYVLRCVLNLPWSTETVRNHDLVQVVKDYLTSVCKNEWDKGSILNLIRDKKRSQIRDETRRALPSLFESRAAWPAYLPKEIPDAIFDSKFISDLKARLEQLKPVTEESMEPVETDKAPRALVLPHGVTVEQLTLDNFRSITGRRFRVTTEQQGKIKAGTLTREQAFAEFIKTLV